MLTRPGRALRTPKSSLRGPPRRPGAIAWGLLALQAPRPVWSPHDRPGRRLHQPEGTVGRLPGPELTPSRREAERSRAGTRAVNGPPTRLARQTRSGEAVAPLPHTTRHARPAPAPGFAQHPPRPLSFSCLLPRGSPGSGGAVPSAEMGGTQWRSPPSLPAAGTRDTQGRKRQRARAVCVLGGEKGAPPRVFRLNPP